MKRFLLAIAVVAGMASCAGDKTTHVNWATFNIRMDTSYDSLNAWQYRKDTVASYILAQNIDIVGMQEVLYNQMQDLAERLPDYEHVGVCRDDGDKEGEASPIFFNKNKFKALDSGTFWLSQYPDSVGFIGWDGACCRIATWAKLEDLKNGNVFMAVNTHFDHVGVEARKNAALLIIDRIKQIVGDKPAVLTGDFNVDDKSEAYATITTNEFVLNDAHKVAEQTSGVAHSFHNWGRKAEEQRSQIDFIFTTPGIRVLKSHIYEEHKIDSLKPETRWGYISDHNPVVAEIEF